MFARNMFLVTQTSSVATSPTSANENLPTDCYGQFADSLVSKGKVREAEINRARRLAAQTDDQTLPALLMKLGILSERDIAEALAEVTRLPLIGGNDYPETSPLPDTVASRFLKENHIVGIGAQEGAFEVAIADPLEQSLLDALALACSISTTSASARRQGRDRAAATSTS